MATITVTVSDEALASATALGKDLAKILQVKADSICTVVCADARLLKFRGVGLDSLQDLTDAEIESISAERRKVASALAAEVAKAEAEAAIAEEAKAAETTEATAEAPPVG